MRVLGVTRRGRPVREAARVYPVGAMARALSEADFVVVLLPLTHETRGIIGAAALDAMKPSAWLINIARGAVVDESALLAALEGKQIAGAVLDVFDREPLPPSHPLWKLDNVVVTPHISGPSTPDEIAPVFNDNLARYLAGRPAPSRGRPRSGVLIMPSRRSAINMSELELARFLDEERVLTCATIGPGGRPHLMPLWYVRDGKSLVA